MHYWHLKLDRYTKFIMLDVKFCFTCGGSVSKQQSKQQWEKSAMFKCYKQSSPKLLKRIILHHHIISLEKIQKFKRSVNVLVKYINVTGK